MSDAEKGAPAVNSGNQDDLDASCAKLWSVYISEAEKYDKALVESWRGDMDGMLIFAGLFSASLTAFIIESYKTLTPDSGNTTAAMLAQISNQLAASASGTTFEAPPPAVFVVPATSIICNILWFISLGFSLSCALIATLVEQWARDFVQKADTRPAPVTRARIFSYLYYGLKRFNMHALVDLVPLLLHMSLVLFFAGLVAFLLPINRTVMAVAAALLGIVVAIYCALSVLPLLYFDCPYRTPFSTVLWRTSQLWRRLSGLVVRSFGRPRESVGHTGEETIVKMMISQATKPCSERDKRDQRALCWTMKSLVDGAELEPFIAGIPDVLWGPEGKRNIHDHLIRSLLDDPDVRLGYRLLDLMRHADSGLLAPDVEVRYKTSCLKALWSIAALSERGTPLNLPLHDFAHQLQLWSRSPLRSRSETCDFLDNHLPTVQAIICWCILCSFDAIFRNLKSDLGGCKADVAAPCFPNAGAIQSTLYRMLEHSQDFHATLHHMSPNLKMISGLVSAEGASQLQVLAHASLLDPVVWIKNVWSFVNDSEDYWDSARHNILSGFLDGSLSLYNRPNTVYKFDSTLKIFQTNKLPPPSALQTKNYAELLEGDAIWERPSEGHGLPNPHATSALAVVISIVFPVSSTSRPVIGLDGINNMISYIRAMMRSSHEVLRTVLDDANNTLLWASIMEYLSCGCPRSYTAERTLEVMCDFYQWLSQTYSLMDPNDRSELDRHSERLPRFNESTLLALEPPHVCPSYYSILAIVKTRILLSLMNQRTKIFERLDKGEIIAFSPEFHERLAERWRLLRGTPLADAETSFFMIPRLPSNSENLVPTQSDWNESISLLSHPLLSKSSLGQVVENDPNFDFEACDDDVQKGAQYLHLLFIVSGRLHDASADVHAGFLEACASRDPPYSTLNILTNHVRIPVSNILLAHPTHRNRFANSIQALMKVRSPTRKQTMIWQHLLRESSILGDTLKHPEPFSRTIRAYGGSYDQTAVLVIKGALREYAKSIRESSDAATSMKERVQDRLQDLDAFLDQIHTVGAIPVVVPKAGVR